MKLDAVDLQKKMYSNLRKITRMNKISLRYKELKIAEKMNGCFYLTLMLRKFICYSIFRIHCGFFGPVTCSIIGPIQT